MHLIVYACVKKYMFVEGIIPPTRSARDSIRYQINLSSSPYIYIYICISLKKKNCTSVMKDVSPGGVGIIPSVSSNAIFFFFTLSLIFSFLFFTLFFSRFSRKIYFFIFYLLLLLFCIHNIIF